MNKIAQAAACVLLVACGGSGDRISSPASPTLVNSDRTFASFLGESGAAIAGGQTLEFTLDNAQIRASGFSIRTEPGTNMLVGIPSRVETTVRPAGGSLRDEWHLTVEAPVGQDLQVRSYDDARKTATSDRPRLEFFGGGVACGSIGAFRVIELEYGPRIPGANDISIRRFRVVFDQQCVIGDQAAPPHMRGEVRIVP